MTRPDKTEYSAYYEQYISQLPECNIIDYLERQLEEATELLASIPVDMENFSYAPGKWNIRQVVSHILDTERIFAYRALRFARNDKTELPGFEQDEYVKWSGADKISLNVLTSDFRNLRYATISLFKSFDEDALLRFGKASGKEISVRAIIYIVAGHTLHHLEVLRKKYLK